MLELGKKQTLKVLRMKEIGAYVGEDEADAGILLPKKELPEGIEVGSELEYLSIRIQRIAGSRQHFRYPLKSEKWRAFRSLRSRTSALSWTGDW